jgi:hypothetical protein
VSAVTGEQLYQELCRAAGAAGKSLSGFVAPLFHGASWKIEQLRIARKPTASTVARVRALIAGDPLPPLLRGRYIRDERAFGLSRLAAEAAGIPPSRRSIDEASSLEEQLARRSRIELARDLAEVAHATRRPGQLLADRVRELRREVA